MEFVTCVKVSKMHDNNSIKPRKGEMEVHYRKVPKLYRM